MLVWTNQMPKMQLGTYRQYKLANQRKVAVTAHKESNEESRYSSVNAVGLFLLWIACEYCCFKKANDAVLV